MRTFEQVDFAVLELHRITVRDSRDPERFIEVELEVCDVRHDSVCGGLIEMVRMRPLVNNQFYPESWHTSRDEALAAAMSWSPPSSAIQTKALVDAERRLKEVRQSADTRMDASTAKSLEVIHFLLREALPV